MTAHHLNTIPDPSRGVRVIANRLEQPDLDNRLYKVIQLPNKLEALLVHDPDADKSSAALDVLAGSFLDDKDLQGQAHAVEHLLFMGTKKYREENEYSQYLSKHSGRSNAYTSSLSTNYYFEVGNEHFHDALDRFAQFFISPLFLEETLDRELRAVDSENKKNLQSDVWRLHQLAKTLSNPNYPYHCFSTGNLMTLKEIPEKRGVNVRDEFMKFYNEHYSANQMKLVVLGREDLNTLERWVVKFFEDVRNKNRPCPRFDGEPLTEEHYATQIFAKPVMDNRSVELTFPYMDEEQHIEAHPGRYISHLIGHEGPGSILEYLRKKGWAHALSAGPITVTPGVGLFKISVSLTEEGLENYQEVVKVVFSYINLIKDSSPQEWIVRELRECSEIEFKFREKSQASKFTSRYASTMQKPSLPRAWLLSGLLRIRKFDPELIEKTFGYFDPTRVRLFITSQIPPYGKFEHREKWYGTEYRVEKLPESFLKALKETAIPGKGAGETFKDMLHFPHKNLFIPTKFDVERKDVERPQVVPNLIKNTDRTRIWYKKDDTFWVPKANVYITLRNPLVYSTPANAVITKLYCDLVRDALSDYAYDAELAGLEYNVVASSIGLEVEVSGYNDKMTVLLEKVVTKMRDLEIQQDRFNIVKERTTRAYKNWHFQVPYSQVVQYSRYLSANVVWLHEELSVEVERITIDDVKNLAPRILRTNHIEALVHGNLYKKDALSYIDLVENILASQPLLDTQHVIRRSIIPPIGKFVWVRANQDEKNVNSVIEYSLYIGEQLDRRLKTQLAVFSQITEEPCFNQLRTKEQLGYVVFSGSRLATTTMYYRVIVQSECSAPYLESRIEEFLFSIKGKLLNLTDKEFESHVKAVIIKKTEKLKSLTHESTRLWNRIGSEFYDFEQVDIEVEILKTLKKEEIIKFYTKYIDPSSNTRRKLSVHMPSAVTPSPADKDLLAQRVRQFLSSIDPTVDLKGLAAALENIDAEDIDGIIATTKKFLQNSGHTDESILDALLAQGREDLRRAPTTSNAQEAFKPENFGEVIHNAIDWKAGCTVTAGARPIKPLIELEDSISKL